MLASFGSLVLSYATTASGGQRTPRGKDKDMGITTSGLTQYSLAGPPRKKCLFHGKLNKLRVLASGPSYRRRARKMLPGSGPNDEIVHLEAKVMAESKLK